MKFAEYLYELYILESRHECINPIDEEKFAKMFEPIEIESQKTDRIEK